MRSITHSSSTTPPAGQVIGVLNLDLPKHALEQLVQCFKRMEDGSISIPKEATLVFFEDYCQHIGISRWLRERAKNQVSASELRRKLRTWKTRVARMSNAMTELASDAELRGFVNRFLPSGHSPDELIKQIQEHGAILSRGDPALALVHASKRNLGFLHHVLLDVQGQISTNPWGGKPRNKLQLKLVEDIAQSYRIHFGRYPVTTAEGPFEELIEIALDVAGWKVGNKRDLMLTALRNIKGRKTLPRSVE